MQRTRHKVRDEASFIAYQGRHRVQIFQDIAEKRLQMSKKLAKIRYALTAYLYQLGESICKDSGSTGGRRELSSNDLDTCSPLIPINPLHRERVYRFLAPRRCMSGVD